MTALSASPFQSTEFTPSGFGVTVPGPEVDEPIEAEEVERLLNNGKPSLRLPEPLEKAFITDEGPQRLRTMLISGVLVAFMFNWLLVSDWLMVPDQFDLALRLRLFLFTPGILVGVFLLTRLASAAMREWLLIFPATVACAMNAWLCMSSTDPMAGPYLSSLATIAMFSNSVVRMRFAPAAVLDAIIARQPALQELIHKAWIVLAAQNPSTATIQHFCPRRGWLAWSGKTVLPQVARSVDWFAGERDALAPALLLGGA